MNIRRLTRGGFVIPAVLLSLLVMSVIAVTALVTSGDEHRSSRAMHESSLAFYAAEAGVHEIWGSFADSVVTSLSAGDSVDFGWQTLTGGGSYRGVVTKLSDDSKAMFMLTVEGRGPGVAAAQRTLSYTLTGGAGGGGGYTLGKCCDAAVTANGLVDIHDENTIISGEDSVPPGWFDDRCSAYTPTDVTGIIAKDTTMVNVQTGAYWAGDPPLEQGDDLEVGDYYTFGNIDYDSILALSTTQLYRTEGQSTGGLKYGGDPAPDGCRNFPVTEGSSSGCWYGPRYNDDGSCDTGHPLNFGAPSGACRDHWPIVRIRGNWAFKGNGAENGYAQGIFVLDTFPSGKGSVFDMEKYAGSGGGQRVVGLLLGKGCMEWEEFAWFFGAVFVDGTSMPLCNLDEPIQVHDDSGIQYSQCAIQEALTHSGLGDAAGGGGGGGLAPISSRAYREMVR